MPKDKRGNPDSSVGNGGPGGAARGRSEAARTATDLFFFDNGAFACTDQTGHQIAKWQGNLLCDHLRKMLRAGVITKETRIAACGGYSTVEEWVGAAGESVP